MNKSYKPFITSAIVAYLLKFTVDIIMYIFMKNEQNDIYYDIWYLLTPQIIASAFMLVFYCMFFDKGFYGAFFRVSTIVLMVLNIAFVVLVYMDRSIDYIYYFALVAAINFLNSLYIKCNILPSRKPGAIEYIPILFELIPFVCMVISLYAVFCSFPTLEVTKDFRYWDYYDVMTAMKLNIVSEAILVFNYFLCILNDCEFIRDNILDGSLIDEYGDNDFIDE